jgi:preprotein translocase subunit YajC
VVAKGPVMLAVMTMLAQAEAAKGGEPPWVQFFPLILIVLSFVFFIFLPMRRDRRHRQEMMASVDKGDKVVVNNAFVGIVDKVVKADSKDFEDELLVKIDENTNVKMRVLRSSVTRVIKDTKKDVKDGA